MQSRDQTKLMFVEKTAEVYSRQHAVRAAVQLIPFIGGPLDTLLGGYGSDIQQKRILHFLEELRIRLDSIQPSSTILSDDELFDVSVRLFEQVVRTRSAQKRSRFAQIISNQIRRPAAADEVELVIRVLGELDDIHIEVLHHALLAPILVALFEGKRIVTLKTNPASTPGGQTNLKLYDVFPNISVAVLRLACSELISKGLLHDEGIGRWDTGSMEYFSPTDFAGRFCSWINASEQQ